MVTLTVKDALLFLSKAFFKKIWDMDFSFIRMNDIDNNLYMYVTVGKSDLNKSYIPTPTGEFYIIPDDDFKIMLQQQIELEDVSELLQTSEVSSILFNKIRKVMKRFAWTIDRYILEPTDIAKEY